MGTAVGVDLAPRYKICAMATRDSSSNVKSMESNHKPLLILRCKCVVVGDACVGKTAITQVFNSGGSTYPKNYVMVCLLTEMTIHSSSLDYWR
jgi:GTPase SAR1 family protein